MALTPKGSAEAKPIESDGARKYIITHIERRCNYEAQTDEKKQRQKSIYTDRKQSKKNQYFTKTIKRRNQTMTLEMYAIKDELNGFAPPIPLPNEETAKRYFKEMLKTNATMQIQPNDFSIWYVGEFYTETGMLTNETDIKLIERG